MIKSNKECIIKGKKLYMDDISVEIEEKVKHETAVFDLNEEFLDWIDTAPFCYTHDSGVIETTTHCLSENMLLSHVPSAIAVC